ncbi:MAG: hypothetical protein COA44_13540 [Arcobacter sp.]|nr:MAG: hypothetical protein COA44_13540 [Arcobacter sp.]
MYLQTFIILLLSLDMKTGIDLMIKMDMMLLLKWPELIGTYGAIQRRLELFIFKLSHFSDLCYNHLSLDEDSRCRQRP